MKIFINYFINILKLLVDKDRNNLSAEKHFFKCNGF